MRIENRLVRVLTEYAASNTYTENDIVLFNGSVYMALREVQGVEPSDGTDANYKKLNTFDETEVVTQEVLANLNDDGIDTDQTPHKDYSNKPMTLGAAKDFIRRHVGGFVGNGQIEDYDASDIDQILRPGIYGVSFALPTDVNPTEKFATSELPITPLLSSILCVRASTVSGTTTVIQALYPPVSGGGYTTEYAFRAMDYQTNWHLDINPTAPSFAGENWTYHYHNTSLINSTVQKINTLSQNVRDYHNHLVQATQASWHKAEGPTDTTTTPTWAPPTGLSPEVAEAFYVDGSEAKTILYRVGTALTGQSFTSGGSSVSYRIEQNGAFKLNDDNDLNTIINVYYR